MLSIELRHWKEKENDWKYCDEENLKTHQDFNWNYIK